MIIDCISDTHGHYPKLEGGDLLIVAGDLTARDLESEHALFDYWINEQPYKKKIVIAGNHDNVLAEERLKFQFCEYLCDSGTEFDGLKIWGSPWSLWFKGINPECKAFTGSENDLKKKFDLIPDDIDILITHSPPYGILDWNYEDKNCGSKSLLAKSRSLPKLKLMVFGHIHEAYSIIDCKIMLDSLPLLLSNNKPKCFPIIVNASHVNEHYKPVNKPVRVIL
jgi:Icc-related predicted phosphoesterase